MVKSRHMISFRVLCGEIPAYSSCALLYDQYLNLLCCFRCGSRVLFKGRVEQDSNSNPQNACFFELKSVAMEGHSSHQNIHPSIHLPPGHCKVGGGPHHNLKVTNQGTPTTPQQTAHGTHAPSSTPHPSHLRGTATRNSNTAKCSS